MSEDTNTFLLDLTGSMIQDAHAYLTDHGYGISRLEGCEIPGRQAYASLGSLANNPAVIIRIHERQANGPGFDIKLECGCILLASTTSINIRSSKSRMDEIISFDHPLTREVLKDQIKILVAHMHGAFETQDFVVLR